MKSWREVGAMMRISTYPKRRAEVNMRETLEREVFNLDAT
jgi:hypothetical protein